MKTVADELDDQKPTHGEMYMYPNIFVHNDDNQKTIFGPIENIAKTTKKSFSYKTVMGRTHMVVGLVVGLGGVGLTSAS